MPRKGPARKRLVEVDPIYGSRLIAKLINRSMYDGKKSVSQKEIYNGLKIIEEKTKENPVTIFERAIENIKPEMEVRAKRVGGACIPSSYAG